MTISNNCVIRVCQEIAEHENLNVTLKSSGEGALIATAAAFIGGMVAGPRGLGVGGTIGSVVAAFYGYNKYKSLVKIIAEDMSEEQKQKLAEAVLPIVSGIGIDDISQLVTFIINHETYLTKIVEGLRSFLLTSMNMQLQ